MKEIKKAYKDILEVCKKYSKIGDVYHFEDIKEMISKAKDHLLIIEWEEKYGIKLDHDHRPNSYNYIRINDWMSFVHYDNAKAEKESGSGRFISWSDDDRQPENEWLLDISFSTGAYIFGDDYKGQEKLFQDFFNELKTYKPDFIDSHNSALYWKLKNAKDIYSNFMVIKNKYHERNRSEFNKRKAERLKAELEKLNKEMETK